MFTYADQRVCPGCRAPLQDPALSCAACGLSLSGAAPLQVFRTLQQVDRLVSDLYAAADRAPVATPTGQQIPQPQGAGQPQHAPPSYPPLQQSPASAPVPAPRAGLSAASVPRILLGLGALCLLVAALVFLAVAWAALGVEGRTLVLCLFTLVAGALTLVVTRRNLRAGAEALSSVTLGLVALDLGGVWNAGWLGDLGDEAFVVAAGLTVAVIATATARWAMTTPVAALVSAEVIATIALVVAAVAVPDLLGRGEAVGTLIALSVFAVGAGTGHVLRLRVLAIGAAGGAALCWMVLVFVGTLRLDELTLAHLWGDLAVWPLLVATALVAAVAVPRRLPRELRVVAAATAVFLGTVVVSAASFDESPTRLALVELGVVLIFALVASRLLGAWRWICVAPSVVAALGLSVSVLGLTAVSVSDLVFNQPWSRGVLDRLDTADVPWNWPLLLPAGVVGISVTVATVLFCADRTPRVVVVPGAAAFVVALGLMPSLYAAPLVIAVVAVVLATAVLAVAAVRLSRVSLLVVALTLVVLALLAGLASDWITAGLLAGLSAAAIAAEVRGSRLAESVARVGAFLAPLSAAGLIWTAGHLSGLDIAVRALPVLLVVGLAIILKPLAEREVGAAAAAVLVIGGSVLGTGSLEVTWLAIHLTTAGVVASVSALLHPSRRHLAWLGLVLLTLAQWIRLQQIGVGTVEAYTLPLAAVLLVVGTVTLLRGRGSSVAMLAPGLGLALIPSLLLVLEDPVSLRAVLLGLACLALVGVGLLRGWAAPLLAGAGVGTLMVLREATYAQVLPQWMIIGLVGLVLTIVGVTWEHRLQEIRRVSSYVRGLR